MSKGEMEGELSTPIWNDLWFTKTSLYDRMGEWVATCRDMNVAITMMDNGFGGCFPCWDGVDHGSSEESALIEAFNQKMTKGKIVRLADVLASEGFEVEVHTLAATPAPSSEPKPSEREER